ncbi:WD40/YVTN/BNR-like repeat-containing protein [Reinekea blandensis]|uniref:Glycosyl hydrolase n=1 Tax=Reinekea blandensis MED297 TaxID=314283 RepID=A4BHJ4_9GAMM|nr:hypothetical protein [Reinekea blandensis]EAR08392.1 Glycosyl hydrolase [Reinekea blandensis MED297]
MSDTTAAEETPFKDTINYYRELSATHAKTARGYSLSITVLIGLGLFVVIALPYVLSMADKLFRGAQSTEAVELRISDIEQQIDEALLAMPPFLASSVFSQANRQEPLYYPGLKPLWPAVKSPDGHWIVTGDEGQVLIGDSSGQNWEEQTTLITDALWPPLFLNNTEGIITGSQGALLVSNDAGATWNPIDLSLATDLNRPSQSSTGVIVITGQDGTLLVRTAANASWRQVNNLATVPLQPAVFNSQGIGVIVGKSGTLLLSDNGGESWRKLTLNTGNDLHWATFDDRRWLVAGDDGTLLMSLDGRDWQQVITATDHTLNRPIITQSGRAIVAAEDGLLLVSDPDWQQWQPIQTSAIADLHPPVETEQGLLIVTGDNGALLTSSNEGQQWIDQSLSVSVDLAPPVFFGTTGLISGDEGALLLSTNNGRSWVPVNTRTPADLKPAVQSPDNDLFVPGDDGTLLMSRDQGLTWQNLQTGIPTDLQPPVFHDDSLATLSSFGGLYQLTDITDLLDEDQLPALVEQLKNSTQPTTANTLAQLEEQKRLLEAYKATLIEFDTSDLNDQLEKSLVRISALAVIMFLVQVLITNYRYSIKLSDYYLARAQGLSVVKELGAERLNADDITSLLNAFTPATEFGKQVATPVDKVMAMAEKFRRG